MAEDNGNGRVTLAIVQHTALQNQAAIRDIHVLLKEAIDANNARLNTIEATIARNDERIKNVVNDVDNLSKRSNVIDGVVAAATAVAAFLGMTR